MAFTAQEAKLGYANGMKVEAGNATFSTTDTTGEVYTSLVYVYSAIAQTTTGKLVCSAPVGAVTSGKITFTRADGTASADVMNFVLYGY
jgi:hypothetical protein